jgi:hypothetical protein
MTIQETAHHEAGHAVAAWSLGATPIGVTIAQKEDVLGSLQHDGDGDSFSLCWTKKEAVICYAGRAAEMLLRGARSAHEAFAMVEGDWSDRNLATDILTRAFSEVRAREVRYQRLAFWLVRRRWEKVRLLAETLLIYEWLRGDEVEILLEDGRDALEEYLRVFQPERLLDAGGSASARPRRRGRDPCRTST